jgi:hypothetical protein
MHSVTILASSLSLPLDFQLMNDLVNVQVA